METEGTPLIKGEATGSPEAPKIKIWSNRAIVIISLLSSVLAYQMVIGGENPHNNFEDSVQLHSEVVDEHLHSISIRETDHPLIYRTTVCMSTHHTDNSTTVIMAWKAMNSSLGWIQAPAFGVDTMSIENGKRCSRVTIYRLRASNKYSLAVFVKTDTEIKNVYSGSFTTGSSGYKFFDSVFAIRNGTNEPSWDLVTTSGSYRETDRITKQDGFRGIFTIDAEGWVVWFYDSQAYTYVFDFTMDYTLITLHAHNTDYVFPGALLEVSLEGQVMQNHTRDGCVTMETYGVLDHETRFHVDDMGNLIVFSTLKTVQDFSGTTEYNNGLYNASYFSGGEVITWDLQTAEISHFDNLFDEITPFRDIYTEREGASYHTFDAICRTAEYSLVIDYMHMNSVQVSRYDGSLIISLHSLSTVVSLNYPEGGVNWIISCSMAHLSSFAFESDNAMFSHQHDVQQIENGNLLLMDNGHKVNNILNSRALELQLDFDKNVVQVGWQHIIDRYSQLGGSVTQTGDEYGPLVVAYCKLSMTNTKFMQGFDQYPSRVYEIDRNGTVMSLLEIPAPEWSWEAGNYRAIPQATLSGELSVSGTWDFVWGE